MTAQDMAVRHYRGLKITPLAYSKNDVTLTVTLPETHIGSIDDPSMFVHIPAGYKTVITSPLCFERHEGSFQYPEELIINAYGLAKVVPSNWRNDMTQDRLECPIELVDAYYTICEVKRKLEDYFRSQRK